VEFLEKLRRLPGYTVLRAIVYLRISTDREEVYSIEEQLFDVLEYAEANGIEIVGEPITDRGLSGGTFEKRAISGIIERVGGGEANLVLVALRDRWGRDPELNRSYERHLQSVGGQLISARRPVDPTTSSGRTQIQTEDFIAGIQRHAIGDAWQNTGRRRRRDGLPHTAAERFGYMICPNCTMHEQTLENGKIRRRVIKKCGDCGGVHVIDPTRGPALKEFYERWTGWGDHPGGESARKLAFEMATRGILSVRGNVMTANQWLDVMDTGYAAGLLRSRTVPRRGRGLTAKYVSDRPDTFDIWEEGKHEAVIEMGCWEKYRKLRAVTPGESRSRAQIKHPLSGILRCGRARPDAEEEKPSQFEPEKLCMRSMNSRPTIFSKNKGKTTADLYGCEGVKHKQCKGINIVRERAHEMVLDWLLENAQNEDLGKAALADQKKARAVLDETRETQQRLTALEKKLSNLVDLKLSGDIHPITFKAKESEFLAEMAPLQGKLDYLKDQAASRGVPPPREEFVAVAKMWPLATAAEKRSMLEPLINHIIVYKVPGTRGNRIRIVPAWERETLRKSAA
jgi:DNA invertase Pin-like site-specific DNA recombinase